MRGEMTLQSAGQLRAARAMLALKQEELARAAGVDVSVIIRQEGRDGRLTARPKTIEALEALFVKLGIEFDSNGGFGVKSRHL
jgi:predicted transcriptional regulator